MKLAEAIAEMDRLIAVILRGDEWELYDAGYLEHEVAALMREHRQHCQAVRDRAVAEIMAAAAEIAAEREARR